MCKKNKKDQCKNYEMRYEKYMNQNDRSYFYP